MVGIYLKRISIISRPGKRQGGISFWMSRNRATPELFRASGREDL